MPRGACRFATNWTLRSVVGAGEVEAASIQPPTIAYRPDLVSKGRARKVDSKRRHGHEVAQRQRLKWAGAESKSKAQSGAGVGGLSLCHPTEAATRANINKKEKGHADGRKLPGVGRPMA